MVRTPTSRVYYDWDKADSFLPGLGHYGPSFFDYFYQQNALILNGTMPGVGLKFNTLGIGNGIIDEYIQSAYYPEVCFLTDGNTHVHEADTVHSSLRRTHMASKPTTTLFITTRCLRTIW